jgi:hypothetical protein
MIQLFQEDHTHILYNHQTKYLFAFVFFSDKKKIVYNRDS